MKIEKKVYDNKKKLLGLVQQTVCDTCEKEIPPYPNVPEGYESPELWKLEEASVAGIPGMRVLRKVLCRECYRAAFKRVYPKEKLPI